MSRVVGRDLPERLERLAQPSKNALGPAIEQVEASILGSQRQLPAELLQRALGQLAVGGGLSRGLQLHG